MKFKKRSKEEYMIRLLKGLKTINRYVILPLLIYLLAFTVYYFFQIPEQFTYQKHTCIGLPDDCQPASAKGIYFYGWQLREGWEIPIVSNEEYERRNNRDTLTGIYAMLAVLIMLGVAGYDLYKSRGD